MPVPTPGVDTEVYAQVGRERWQRSMGYDDKPVNVEPGGQARSILIVDADAGSRLYISVILKKNGYHIIEARDADAGLAAFADARPDLCIVDLTTADVAGGLELCRQIHTRPGARRQPVLVLANRGRPEDVARGLSAGADRVLLKPILSCNLLADVRQLLAGGGKGRAGR
jgi:two-component system phosphate regulon response regulator PhoB